MSHLAIDTATEACSAALSHEGKVHERFQLAPRRHADLILPMVDELLEEAGCRREQIEWIAFGRGPGAFTGVRIAAGVAHGLALGLGCGLVPVSTLAALALEAHEQEGTEQVLACLDARMGEVYWGGYRIHQGVPEVVVAERVCSPDAVNAAGLEDKALHATGPGWAVYEERLVKALGFRPAAISADRFPRAAAMLGIAARRLAQGEKPLTPAEAQPIYLRDKVAEPSRN